MAYTGGMRLPILLFSISALTALAQPLPNALDNIKEQGRKALMNPRRLLEPVQVFRAAPAIPDSGVCSVPMPRMAVAAAPDPRMAMPLDRVEVREKYAMPLAAVPAPECAAAAAATGQPANPSPAPPGFRVLPAPTRPNPFGELVTRPRP